MGKTRKVIVVSNSYLLTVGIENLVLELSGLLVDCVFVGSEKQLYAKVVALKPEFVIIDPNSVAEILIPLTQKLDREKDFTIIGLISETTKLNIISQFKYTLNTQNTKYQLIESLKKIVGKDSKYVQQNEQLLSKRETEILKNLALGLTNQEIANKLFLSIHTVMTHRKNITRKLNIKTVSGLTVYALMNKLVDIREVERQV